MSGGAVPQTVRTHVRRARDRTYYLMHSSSDDPLVDPPTASTQEQRHCRVGTREGGASLLEPATQRSLRRHSIGNDALLGSLAKYPDQASLLVDVSQVKPAKLGDPYSGRVQQLDGRMITQRNGVRLSGAALRGVQCGGSLFRMQYRRQGSPRTRPDQPGTWVTGHQPDASCPSGKSACCGGAPG
jgi:hypothetical protein